MKSIQKFGARVISVINSTTTPFMTMTHVAHRLASSPSPGATRHHSSSLLNSPSIQKALKTGYHDTFVIDENMPPKKRRASTKQADDDDFVVDEDFVPEPKRSKAVSTKATKTSKAKSAAEKTSKAKRSEETSKAAPDGSKKTDEKGQDYWELGGRLRRVTVSEFKGNTFINIREHYEKDGDILPGKKGISLNIDQFSALLSVLPQIEASLEEKSVTVPRPNYGGALKANDQSSEEAEAPEEEFELESAEEEEDEDVKLA